MLTRLNESEAHMNMKRLPILVSLLLPRFAVHAAPIVTTHSESVMAGTAPATGPQAPADTRKTPAAGIPGVSVFVGRGSSGKPAWEWSDEERIGVRFDPASIRERAAAHADSLPPYSQAQAQAQSAQAPRASQHIIDGSHDPGLFLPVELLDVLLEGLHPNAKFRTHARVALAKDIRGMGYTEDDFWNKLQQLSAPYRALTSRPKNLTIKRVKTPDGKIASFPIDLDRCVARYNLLQSARATFGAQTFQRFLYTAVAPHFWSGESTQRPDPAQELVFIAGGCR
jgi:hypothetical protein